MMIILLMLPGKRERISPGPGEGELFSPTTSTYISSQANSFVLIYINFFVAVSLLLLFLLMLMLLVLLLLSLLLLLLLHSNCKVSLAMFFSSQAGCT